MMRRFFIITLLIGAPVCFGQGSVFKLQVPDFGDQVFDSDQIEIPGPEPRSLLIQMRKPASEDVDYGRIATRVNGEGAGFVTTVASAEFGKLIRLDLSARETLRLKNGLNVIEISAVNRRGRKYYRSFVLHTREKARNPYFAYASRKAGEDADSPVPVIDVFRPAYPIVLELSERERVVALDARIAAGNELAAVIVQGQPISASGMIASIRQDVKIGSGSSGLQIEARDIKGNTSSLTIPIRQAERQKPAMAGGQRWALLIGISDHRAMPPLPRIARASADTNLLAEKLVELGGFDRERILLLEDSRATAAQLRNAFRNWIAKAAPDDLMLVYYAGYALHDPFDLERIYLAAHDSQLKVLSETAIPYSDLRTLFASNLRVRQSLLVFDIVQSLPAEWSVSGNNLAAEYLLRLFPQNSGRTVLVRASSENGVGASGLLVQAMIDGARGSSDWNRDGVITVTEWVEHTSASVRAMTVGAENPRYSTSGTSAPLFVSK